MFKIYLKIKEQLIFTATIYSIFKTSYFGNGVFLHFKIKEIKYWKCQQIHHFFIQYIKRTKKYHFCCQSYTLSIHENVFFNFLDPMVPLSSIRSVQTKKIFLFFIKNLVEESMFCANWSNEDWEMANWSNGDWRISPTALVKTCFSKVTSSWYIRLQISQ